MHLNLLLSFAFAVASAIAAAVVTTLRMRNLRIDFALFAHCAYATLLLTLKKYDAARLIRHSVASDSWRVVKCIQLLSWLFDYQLVSWLCCQHGVWWATLTDSPPSRFTLFCCCDKWSQCQTDNHTKSVDICICLAFAQKCSHSLYISLWFMFSLSLALFLCGFIVYHSKATTCVSCVYK